LHDSSIGPSLTYTNIFRGSFLGFCDPAGVTADQVSLPIRCRFLAPNKGRFNADAESSIGAAPRAKIFGEVGYNEMFTNVGPNLTFVLVSFGIAR